MKRVALIAVLLCLAVPASAQLFAPSGAIFPSPAPRAYGFDGPVAQCVIARPCPWGDCVILTACPTGTLVPPQPVPPMPIAAQLPAEPEPPVVIQLPSCPVCTVPPPTTKPAPPPATAAPKPAHPRVAVRPAPPPKPLVVNLNTASLTDLEKLPMIDKAHAEAMQAGRPYSFTHELVTKQIVTPEVFRIIDPYVVVR